MLIVLELNEQQAVAVLEGCVQLVSILRIVDGEIRGLILEEKDT